MFPDAKSRQWTPNHFVPCVSLAQLDWSVPESAQTPTSSKGHRLVQQILFCKDKLSAEEPPHSKQSISPLAATCDSSVLTLPSPQVKQTFSRLGLDQAIAKPKPSSFQTAASNLPLKKVKTISSCAQTTTPFSRPYSLAVTPRKQKVKPYNAIGMASRSVKTTSRQAATDKCANTSSVQATAANPPPGKLLFQTATPSLGGTVTSSLQFPSKCKVKPSSAIQLQMAALKTTFRQAARPFQTSTSNSAPAAGLAKCANPNSVQATAANPPPGKLLFQTATPSSAGTVTSSLQFPSKCKVKPSSAIQLQMAALKTTFRQAARPFQTSTSNSAPAAGLDKCANPNSVQANPPPGKLLFQTATPSSAGTVTSSLQFPSKCKVKPSSAIQLQMAALKTTFRQVARPFQTSTSNSAPAAGLDKCANPNSV